LNFSLRLKYKNHASLRSAAAPEGGEPRPEDSGREPCPVVELRSLRDCAPKIPQGNN